MDQEREHTEEEATSVDEPTGRTGADTPYDPEMTEGDEANVPPESEADPQDSRPSGSPDAEVPQRPE